MPEDSIIQGAYVDLNQLTALRHKRMQAATADSRIVGNRAGQKLSKVKGRGVDFAEVRLYQPGDDIRAIDWRVTARKNEPHTKIFREERERPILVVVDQTQNMFFGSKLRLKSVAAAELAARIAWQNLAAGDRVGGVVIGNAEQSLHKPYRTTKSVARLLNDIALYNQRLERQGPESAPLDPHGSLHEGMLRVRRATHNNYRVFIISDFAGPLSFWREQLHQLARRNNVVAVNVYDPLEARMPPSDHYVVTNGSDRVQFFSGERAARARYERRFTERTAELKSICNHEAMHYLSIATIDTSLDNYAWT